MLGVRIEYWGWGYQIAVWGGQEKTCNLETGIMGYLVNRNKKGQVRQILGQNGILVVGS